MGVSFIAAAEGTLQNGATSGSFGFGSAVVGDLRLVFVMYYGTGAPDTPSGFEVIVAPTGGTDCGIAVYGKVVTVSGVQPNVTINTPTNIDSWIRTAIYEKSPAGTWQISAATGSDSVANTTWSVTAALEVAAGDLVIAMSSRLAGPPDDTPDFTTYALTGGTFTNTVRQETGIAGAGPSNNKNLGYAHTDHAASAPTTSIAYQASTLVFGSGPTGITAFVRLRDTTPPLLHHQPVITLVSPPPGSISYTDPIVVDVTDPDGVDDLLDIVPHFLMPTVGLVELAHDFDDDFTLLYIDGSTRTSITNGYRYTFNRATGWVDAVLKLSISATGGGPQMVGELFEWTTDYGGSYACSEAPPPTNRPVIEIVSPLPYNDSESVIADRTTHLVFRVTDPDLEATPATVEVTFSRAVGDSPPARTIPAGWIVKTAAGVRFATDEDADFPDSDGGPITVSATAVVAGEAGNVGAGEITVIEDIADLEDLGGMILLEVTNADAAEGGGGVIGGNLERAIPILIFPDANPLDTELVHDGDSFYPKFAGSTRTAIEGGFEYDLIWYTGEWPLFVTESGAFRVKLLPFAYDFTGLEAL